MSTPVCVLDASVGVKWFRAEAGSEEARDLLARHIADALLIVVDAHFLYEVLAVAARDQRADDVDRVWGDLFGAELGVVPLGLELVHAAAAQREALGCSLYDAFAPGLASLLGAPLYSADARAHASYPDVRLIRV